MFFIPTYLFISIILIIIRVFAYIIIWHKMCPLILQTGFFVYYYYYYYYYYY